MMRPLYICAPMALSAVACAPSSDTTAEPAPSQEEAAPETIAVANLQSAEGTPNGTVTLTESGDSLILALNLMDIDPGEKAFHLHTTGQCDAPDFKSAGGHLNPFDKTHGSLSENGEHLGDFTNVEIADDGTVETTRTVQGNASDLLDLIFDEDGTAVMIHAGPDDYATDPAGAAGPRIACGILEKSS